MPDTLLRRLVLLVLLLALGFGTGACSSLCRNHCAATEAAQPEPAAEPTDAPAPLPDPEPAVPEEPAEEASPLAVADAAFEAGDLTTARLGYRTYLESPDSTESDHALLRLAIIYLQPDGPLHDPARAERVVDQLLADFPASRVRAEALALRALQRRARELQHQLDELKRVDLEPPATDAGAARP